MKLRPLQDRVIVKQQEAEEKTKSGIYLPDAAKEKPTTGKVVAVGPGRLDENGKAMELSVRAGDTVYLVGAHLAQAHLRNDGILADVSPTILQLLNIPQPKDMSGRSLLQS